MKAVILAGGEGTRLKPYTTHFPKPLMPIGDKPILEIILRSLKSHGINDIIITVGYLKEFIQLFFGDGQKFGVNIEYSSEEKPLGTAGPLGLLRDKLQEPFLVMNGDILSNISFASMVQYHKEQGKIGTLALASRSVNIDFGVVELDKESFLENYIEKPKLNHLVSMGVYILDPTILDYIPVGSFLTLPDLVMKVKHEGERMAGYVHKGSWLDIGRPSDYEEACRNSQLSGL